MHEDVTAIPSGWSGHVGKVHYWLAGATFSDSKDVAHAQDDQGELLDDNYSGLMWDQEINVDANGTIVYTWLFPDAATYTLRCLYDRTCAELTQALPPDIRACQLTQFEQHSGRARLDKVECFKKRPAAGG